MYLCIKHMHLLLCVHMKDVRCVTFHFISLRHSLSRWVPAILNGYQAPSSSCFCLLFLQCWGYRQPCLCTVLGGNEYKSSYLHNKSSHSRRYDILIFFCYKLVSWVFCLFVCLFLFLETRFLCCFGSCPGTSSCRPCWLQTHRDLPASASKVLRLMVCHHHPALTWHS